MAEHVVFPLNVKLHLHRNIIKGQFFVPRSTQITIQRKCYSASCKPIQFSSWNPNSMVASHLTSIKVHRLEESLVKCCCLGTLVNADNVITSEWVPIIDQVLLMASIFLTYSAGVIPAGKLLRNDRKGDSNDFAVPKISSHSGSTEENDREVDIQFTWDKVKVKLLDSFDAMKQGGKFGIRVAEFQKEFALRPSSLFALAEFPRLRLLWASFLWLKKEVGNLCGKSHTGSNGELSLVFTRIIQNFCQPVFMAWLEEELGLINSSPPNKTLLSAMINKLNGHDSLLQCIRQSGKQDLYAELIFALGFGSARMNGYYGHSLFTQHGVAILEDLVITLADGIAIMYLELISVDSSMSNEMNSLGLSLCALSTRALQKLRNEVAMHQWLHQNMESVISMYEDRFELRTFRSHVFEKSSKFEAENCNWWKRFSMRSGPMMAALSFILITPFSIPVKRTKELRALTGWQYYYSLYLELADIAMPLVRTVVSKISDAISFFLVYLIGRSLGLIYTGIRQSLRWK